MHSFDPRRSCVLCPRIAALLQDKEGYTPLHIAAGYLNRGVVRLLLSAGADPELEDRQGRSALDLIVALKENTPTTPDFFARRGALDEVAKARADVLACGTLEDRSEGMCLWFNAPALDSAWLAYSACMCVCVCAQELETHLFEELEPCAIVAKRGSSTEEGAGPVEYLVNWGDGSEETWEVSSNSYGSACHMLTLP